MLTFIFSVFLVIFFRLFLVVFKQKQDQESCLIRDCSVKYWNWMELYEVGILREAYLKLQSGRSS